MAPTSKTVNPILYNSALQNYRHTLIIIILNLHWLKNAFTESKSGNKLIAWEIHARQHVYQQDSD